MFHRVWSLRFSIWLRNIVQLSIYLIWNVYESVFANFLDLWFTYDRHWGHHVSPWGWLRAWPPSLYFTSVSVELFLCQIKTIKMYFFFHKDDITIRFRILLLHQMPTGVWLILSIENSSQDLGVYFENGRENLNFKTTTI